MAYAALHQTVDEIRGRVGDSLVALDVWESESALSLAGFGTTAATGPMLQRLTDDLRRAASLAGTRFDDYHVLTVEGGAVLVVSRPHLGAALVLTDDADLAWVVGDVVPAVRAALDAATI